MKPKGKIIIKKRTRNIILIAAAVVVALLAAAGIYFLYMTSGFKHVDISGYDLGIAVENETEAQSDEETVNSFVTKREPKTDSGTAEEPLKNIAIFGIDSTDKQAAIGDQYRSDSIIVMSLLGSENTLKLSSILRDSKVPIEGHDPQKINAAYKYGFAPLAIKTLNQNFKLDISDYITVDFAGLESVIDILGGVEVELTDEESRVVGVDPGLQTLNGRQALSYSRIRKIDNDYYRASRQQTVFSAVMEKLKGYSVTQYPTLLHEFLTCVETSLTYGELMGYLSQFDLNTIHIETITIPDYDYEENLWGGIDETGSWVWIYDIDAAAERLKEFIYGTAD